MEITCPQQISTNQSLVEPVAEWEEFIRPSGVDRNLKQSNIYRIDLYDGEPKEIAQLKPNDVNASNQTWIFSGPAPANRPVYMSCAASNFDPTKAFHRDKLPVQKRTNV
ncbi:hypothetical protein H0A36_19160 [Endozoicomonas sp. SM1973]|uniref:Uncharacterized protein n=1 Tax=Spartinivicinus marinus TaxID=2994442 RepID=A0A853I2G3_9GAMM|nr:STY0301 family protein [Spartinivicinus marinus]MCX4025955.1 hypothetical protein [Spartinivicinus marinus]NYZ68140.1 hypothetical protein [Spartinivicinus marinus]